MIVTILKREPWRYRDSTSGKIKIFEDGQWRDLPREDLPRITKLQAQAWLILYNLLLDPESQRKYLLDEHRKEVILSIRPLVTEHLTNQLPVLELLQRYLDELVLFNVPESIPHNRFVQEVCQNTISKHLTITCFCYLDIKRQYS